MTIALVDCNNFYVSCERVFNPKLEGVPVAVLSNNDGCIVSRSQEVKSLGINMASPIFKIQEELKRHNVILYSSNYALYGDMSRRVMDALETICPTLEIYSIDEAFLNVSHVANSELEEFGREIKQIVKTWTGIPVSVGIGQTKTLAKIANHYSKKHQDLTKGVYSLVENENLDEILKWCPVHEIWGVGRKNSLKLRSLNIYTAYDLKNANKSVIRKRITVTGEITLLELRGIPCIALELEAPVRKSVASTRSFGNTVFTLDELSEAIALFVDKASLKLRREKLVARVVQVFIRTDRFKRGAPQYHPGLSSSLPIPTNNVNELNLAAQRLLKAIYKTGYGYKKAGVLMTDLSSEDSLQLNLFESKNFVINSHLMKAYDKINTRYGTGSIVNGSQSLAIKTKWHMKRSMLSPAYTTSWDDLPIVR